MLPGSAGAPDFDRDSCADIVEALDNNGDRIANGGDKLQLDRAVAQKAAWLPPAVITLSEMVLFDVNSDRFANGSDQLTMNRVLAGKFGTINLNCTAAAIGIPAN